MDEAIPEHPDAFRERMAHIVRRSGQATDQMHKDIARIKARDARAAAGEDSTPEIVEEIDTCDVPELQDWADDLGYRHGYAGHALSFLVFAQIMRKELGPEFSGLEPKHYESYYVGGHMRGEHAMVAQAEYAFEHGERAPVVPFLRDDLRG